jgi:ribosomal RNA-processing protein 8
MKIAEVVSRFSDIDGFIDLVESLGFDFMEKVNRKRFVTGNRMLISPFFSL